MLLSGIRPDLSFGDKEVKHQLAKCLSRVYSKLIRSDIPGPSGVNPSRPPALRPFLPSVMKPSREGPSAVKPTWEELQALVESLAKKKRSVKRKAQAPPESILAIRGKILRFGASSPPSTAKERGSSDQVSARGQAPPSMAEVSKVAGLKNPFERTVEPPLEVLPISVWSPSAQNAKLHPTTSEDEGRDWFGTEGNEDSILTNLELAVGAVSSIIRDFDLKRTDTMSIEEALALSLQGAASVCPDAFICSFHHCFKLSINFISSLHMATYMKSLEMRASAEGSDKAVKVYKAKVTSLTSEKADLRARFFLAKDAVKYESDLKHTITAKAREKKKARGELRVAEDELRAVKDELQVARNELHVVRDELHIKAMTLSQVSQEDFEVVSFVECLTEECHGLHGDLKRQEALLSQKEGVIAELIDEACTLWASRWLAFRRKDAKFSRVWISTFKFLLRGRQKNLTLTTKQTPWCFQMPSALFLSLMNLRLRLLQRPALLPRSLGLHLLTYMVRRFR